MRYTDIHTDKVPAHIKEAIYLKKKNGDGEKERKEVWEGGREEGNELGLSGRCPKSLLS